MKENGRSAERCFTIGGVAAMTQKSDEPSRAAVVGSGLLRSRLHVRKVVARIVSKAHQGPVQRLTEEDETRDCYGIPRLGEEE